MAEAELQKTQFDFSGNALCLDFTNTVNDRTSTPRELLRSYDDLLSWSEQASVLTGGEIQRLREGAVQRPREAQAVVSQAIVAREAIYALCVALVADAAPAEADVRVFNTMLAGAMARLSIQAEGDGFVWSWREKGTALDCMLWPVLRSAADLLTSEARERLRMCAAEDCGWLFLDTSKNHSRRWCDMKGCGNRAKARNHYRQKKQFSE